MGLFGGGDSGGDSGAEASMNAQIQQQQAELEEQRKNLYTSRLEIIKSSAGQTWTPQLPPGSTTKPGGGVVLNPTGAPPKNAGGV